MLKFFNKEAQKSIDKINLEDVYADSPLSREKIKSFTNVHFLYKKKKQFFIIFIFLSLLAL